MIKNTKIILILIAYIFLLRSFWNHVSADESYMDSREYLEQGNINKALEQANKSILKNPNEPRYFYNRAKIYIATLEATNKQKANTDLKTAEELNPKNLVTLRNIIPIYYLLAANLEDNQTEDINKVFIILTTNYYTRMNDYSSNDVGLFALLYKYENLLGLENLAEKSKTKIEELRPDLLEWYIKN